MTLAPLTLGETVRHLRGTYGMTLEWVAKRAGMSISYLSDIERGRRGCPVATAAKIAKAMREAPEHFIQLVLDEELRGLGLEVVVRRRFRDVP